MAGAQPHTPLYLLQTRADANLHHQAFTVGVHPENHGRATPKERETLSHVQRPALRTEATTFGRLVDWMYASIKSLMPCCRLQDSQHWIQVSSMLYFQAPVSSPIMAFHYVNRRAYHHPDWARAYPSDNPERRQGSIAKTTTLTFN